MTAPSQLRSRDALRVAATGVRARPLRAALSALGIAFGIAAMVAVVGISASSRAEIDQQLQALGTNLLTVEPGQMFGGDTLPGEIALPVWVLGLAAGATVLVGAYPGARAARMSPTAALATV